MSPPCVSRSTPSLNTDEKELEGEEGDDTNSNVSAGPPDPHPETSSAEPNATRRQSVVPVSGDETAVPFPTDLGSRPSNRTSLSTSFKIHGGV